MTSWRGVSPRRKMATEDAKLRKEIEFLTSLIKQHKTSKPLACYYSAPVSQATDYSTAAQKTRPTNNFTTRSTTKSTNNFTTRSTTSNFTPTTTTSSKITNHPPKQQATKQPPSGAQSKTLPGNCNRTKTLSSEKNQYKWVAGTGTGNLSNKLLSSQGKTSRQQNVKDTSSSPPVGPSTGSSSSVGVGKVLGQERGLKNGFVISPKLSTPSPSKPSLPLGKTDLGSSSKAASKSIPPAVNLFKVNNIKPANSIVQMSHAKSPVTNTLVKRSLSSRHNAKNSKYQLIKHVPRSPMLDAIASPSLSPVRSSESLNLSRNPSFLGSTPNSPASSSSPFKFTARVRHTSTPKESLSPDRPSVQSRYKLVKATKPNPKQLNKTLKTVLQSRYKLIKRNSSSHVSTPSTRNHFRTRKRTVSFSKPKVLTRYKLIKSLPESYTKHQKIQSSNKLVKRAVMQAHRNKRNSLSWSANKSKNHVNRHSLKLDNTRHHQKKRSSREKHSSRTAWVKKYSLKRENTEKSSELSVNQLLGRSVTDLSKNRYKFIKGAGKRTFNRYKVNNKEDGGRLRRHIGTKRGTGYWPVLSRSKLKIERRLVRSPFPGEGPQQIKFDGKLAANWRERSSSASWSRFSYSASFSNHGNSITRLRASYAIKRSVHTAATAKLRHQKPRKTHCLFYNRFGRCKRGDRCPNIHDPERVAVCTRFLRGTCQITDCPFSHKVAKEKMPVCRFFLRGVCNRDDCPYVHVNVNKGAQLCEDFAKGYCALGDKCKKKHLLVCPDFSRDGKCPRGKECFLKHQKKKPAKRKISEPAKKGNPANGLVKEIVTSSQSAKVLKRERKQVFDDGDDINLPLKERRLPSFIALESNSVGQLSASEASLTVGIGAPLGILGKKGIYPSFLPQGK